MGKMKLPTGYGSICKLPKNRRKKYAVRITVGWDENGKQIRKYIGYGDSNAECLKILANYHNNPYNLDYKNLLFKDVWVDVLNKLDKLVEEGRMSQSNVDSLSFAYNNHCTPLYNDKLLELKYKKMQDIIDNASNKSSGKELGYTAKGFIKTVCVKIFNCAIDDYELPINTNPAIKLVVGSRTKSDKHIPFTEDEISVLWSKQSNNVIKILLIYIYTGLRPNELFITLKDNIHIEKNYFITGSKTKAGINRIIPIHPKIKHLIEHFYNKDSQYPFATIYDNFNYGKYKREFTKVMTELDFDHTPYDGRHTFITKMKHAGVNEYILKRIIGHSIGDITEEVYTHRRIEELYNEILKIN